jgi:glycosyltransferase involved in cell wall biosynthesis
MSGHLRIWGENPHKVFIRNVKVENIGRNYITLQERISKFPRDENLIVIVDKNRRRSPLLSFFQDQLCSMKSDFNFVRETNTDKNIIEIINGLGVIPGYIFTGFRTNNYLDKNVDLLRSNKIKVICETGDPWLFNRQRFYRSILSMKQQGVKVVALVSHSSDGIENITNLFPEIPLIVVPWMMNKVLDSGRVRSIDVAWVGTVSSFKHHTNKQKVNEIIMKIKGVNIYHKKIHGENYLRVLKDSKIFVVAGRVKDTMVQKYVEGAMCGCLMIGELPSEGRHILEGGIVEVQRGDYHDIEHKIKYYLKNSKERKQIARTGQKAMCKYRNPKEICETFISDLKGVIHGKT